MQFQIMLGLWMLTSPVSLAERPDNPIIVDRIRAIQIADETNAALGGFPHPVYKAIEQRTTWFVLVEEEHNYIIGHHCLITIDKQTGKVIRVTDGK